ncbi:MAG: aquaporin Z [Bacteroidetes bacterium]|nr:MAG: aquaporin Z [Bacteroidota bacterium]
MRIKKLAAELLGTFIIVFFGTGAIVADQENGGAITHTGISLAFGLAVAVSIIFFGKLSGAHFNPAVSLGFAMAGRFAWKDVSPYIIAQLAGAFAGSMLLKIFFPANEKLGTTLPSGTELQSFLLELLLTFLLMLVILRASANKKLVTAVVASIVGLVVGLEAYFAGPYCGASMNSARSLAPAVVSGHTESLWLYLVAPTGGAVLAVFADRLIPGNKKA